MENLEDLEKLDCHQHGDTDDLHLYTHVFAMLTSRVGEQWEELAFKLQPSHACENRNPWKPPSNYSEVILELQNHKVNSITNHCCSFSYLFTFYCTQNAEISTVYSYTTTPWVMR